MNWNSAIRGRVAVIATCLSLSALLVGCVGTGQSTPLYSGPKRDAKEVAKIRCFFVMEIDGKPVPSGPYWVEVLPGPHRLKGEAAEAGTSKVYAFEDSFDAKAGINYSLGMFTDGFWLYELSAGLGMKPIKQVELKKRPTSFTDTMKDNR